MNASTDSAENPASAQRELEEFRVTDRADQHGQANNKGQGQKHRPLDQLEIGVPDTGLGLAAFCSPLAGLLTLDIELDLATISKTVI